MQSTDNTCVCDERMKVSFYLSWSVGKKSNQFGVHKDTSNPNPRQLGGNGGHPPKPCFARPSQSPMCAISLSSPARFMGGPYLASSEYDLRFILAPPHKPTASHAMNRSRGVSVFEMEDLSPRLGNRHRSSGQSNSTTLRL